MTQTTTSGGPSGPPNGRAAPGTTIGGRYELRAAVGHGGMGTVWRAADTLLRREVAVKEVVLPPGLAPSDRDAMYERTLREARAAAALSHPAVVQVYDVVTENNRPWIVMELLDARSLADMVIEDGPVAPRAVAKIGIALLGALEVAHAAGVLHRDVKPANVLICSDGRCVLTDFGVARMPTDVQLTTPGMVLGSPHFISPERAMGGPFGPPSDLFSLGVTLYTAVEGRPPFDKGDPIETMHAVVEDVPAPPHRAGPLASVLFGLLEKDPARRWSVPTARQALRDLLAGPLASSTPQFITDPYAVVPTQRTTWTPGAPATPEQPAEPAPSGQIGGRAMLAPGESLSDRIAARSTGPAGAPAGPAAPAPPPTPQPPPLAYGPPGAPAPGWPAQPPYPGPPAQSYAAPPQPPYPAAPPDPRFGGPPPPAPGWPPGSTGPASHGGSHRSGASSLLATVRSWPRRTQVLAAAGVAAVVLAATIGLLSLGDPPGPAPVDAGGPPSQAPSAAAPEFGVQQHAGKGVQVNVPDGWTRAVGGVYVDYTDPRDNRRRVRILVENFNSSSPERFITVAENGLRTRPNSCTRPYVRMDMRTDVQLAGQPAAELEYTCASGDAQRHGIWRAVVRDGKAYSFFLTTRESRFAESLPIFEEMVRSFQLASAN